MAARSKPIDGALCTYAFSGSNAYVEVPGQTMLKGRGSTCGLLVLFYGTLLSTMSAQAEKPRLSLRLSCAVMRRQTIYNVSLR